MNTPSRKPRTILQKLVVLFGLIATATSCVSLVIVGAKLTLILVLLFGAISVLGTAFRAAGDSSEIASEAVGLMLESISMVFEAISSLFN